MHYKPRFRPDLTELRKSELQKAYDDYWASMNVRLSPHIEYPLLRWVEQGNSPYTNPEWRFDKNTGELMDFWSAKLEKDREITIDHLMDLEQFGRWEDLESLKQCIDDLTMLKNKCTNQTKKGGRHHWQNYPQNH